MQESCQLQEKPVERGSQRPAACYVAGIIPACRWFERRWSHLSDDDAADSALKPAFRRDQILLWVLAIGLPAVLTAFFKLIFS